MVDHLLLLNFSLVLAGLAILALHSQTQVKAMRIWGTVTTGLQCWLTLEMYLAFNLAAGGIQYQIKFFWFGSEQLFGLDGLNLPFLASVNLLMLLCVLFSWQKSDKVKNTLLSLLFIDFSLNGLLTSYNLLLQIILLGLLLFSIYCLLLTESDQRIVLLRRYSRAAMIGYCCILLGILLIYFSNATPTFDLVALSQTASLPEYVQTLAALLLLMGVAFLMPLFPLQNWLVKNLSILTDWEKIIFVSLLNKGAFFLLIRPMLSCFSLASGHLVYVVVIWGALDLLYCSLLSWGQKDYSPAMGYWQIAQSGLLLSGISLFLSNNAGRPAAGAGVIYLALALLLVAPLLLCSPTFGSENVPHIGIRRARTVGQHLAGLLILGIPGSALFIGYLLFFTEAAGLPWWPLWLALFTLGIMIGTATVGKHWWPGRQTTIQKKCSSYTQSIIYLLLIVHLMLAGIAPSLWYKMLASGLHSSKVPNELRQDKR